MKEFEISHCQIFFSKQNCQISFEILPFSSEINKIQLFSKQIPTETRLNGREISFKYKNNIVEVELSERKSFNLYVSLSLSGYDISNGLSTVNDGSDGFSRYMNGSTAKTLEYDRIPHFVNEKYPMDFKILSDKDELVICVGELQGKYLIKPSDCNNEISNDQILWKYSCKTAVSPKSVVIVYGIFECLSFTQTKPVSFEPGNDDVPELLQQSKSKIQVFYDKTKYREDWVRASFYLMPQAVEFVEQYVGASFPFSYLKIIISDSINVPIKSFATVLIVSANLLISQNVIDHVFLSRFYIVSGIVHQWFGHYISIASVDDLWLVVGFSRWIAYQFMKKIHGNNEVVFRLKKDMERLCLLDVKQPPLNPSHYPKLKQDLLVGYDLDPFEDTSSHRGELMNLKSPLVLYMMEKRFGKGLLSKLSSKIMMSQMSGELVTGLSTVSFLKLSRKLSAKLEIKDFADQWIYKSGSPIFTTTYNFNRKKMMIEVRIKQRSSNEGMVGANPKFTGPFVIRIREPAGTFDTEVLLDEYMRQYDIIYHTKYKRIRRGTSKRKRNDEDEDEEEDEEEEGGEDEVRELMTEPDRITFEWIRCDPDSLWACHKTFEQDDFMWNASLKQDKDIIAQYEAVIALGKIPSTATCATLMWVLKDPGFFYRVRMEAALALTKFDNPDVEYIGLTNLTKFLKENYCMETEDQLVPKRNNFDDLQDYYLKCGICQALAKYRDSKGWSPPVIRSMLIDLLRFNDNTNNKSTDSTWIAMLIDLIGETFLARPKNADDLSWLLSDRVHYKPTREIKPEDIEEFDLPQEKDEFSHKNSEIVKLHFQDEDHQLLQLALDQVMKCLKRDRFAGSHNNSVTIACLELLMKWQIAGLAEPTIALFLSYSRHGHLNLIRRVAIESLIVISGLEKPEMVRYLAHLCIDDPDPFIRYVTSLAMMNFIAISCQQIQMSTSLDARKHTLQSQIKVMMEVWSPVSPEMMDFVVYRYLAKIVDMVREVLPEEKDRLKYTLPIVYTETEEEAVVPEVVQPTIKPLKLNFKALPATSSPPKKVAGDRRGKILKKLMNQKNAYWFNAPVDPVKYGLPTYFDIIKHPMDFSTIKKRLDSGIYKGEEDFAADVRLVFSNSLLFNPPGSQVNTDATLLSQMFEKEFGGVAVVEPITVEADIEAAPAKAKAAPPAFKHLTAANRVVDKLLESKHSAIFRYQVDGEMYPDYYKVITNPIDLQIIKKKIVTKEYASFQDFHSDMQLMINNCFTFNKKGTFGCGAGVNLQNVYLKLLKPYLRHLDPDSVQKIVPPSASAVPVPSVFAATPGPTPKVKLRLPPGPSGLTLKLSRPKSIDSPGTPGPSPLSSAPVQTLQTLQTPSPAMAGTSPKIVLRLPPRSTPIKNEAVAPGPEGTPIATPRIKLTFRLPPKKSTWDQSITPKVDESIMDVDPVSEKPPLPASDTLTVPATPTPAPLSTSAAKVEVASVTAKEPEIRQETPIKGTSDVKPSQNLMPAPKLGEETEAKTDSSKVDETPKPKIKLKFKFNSGK